MNAPSENTSSPWLRVFLPFAVGYFLSYFFRNANAVIAPELVRELGVSAADLGLLTSAYLLTFGAFQLPLGLLLDRFGPRKVETALLLLAALGSAAFAFGHNLTELALARAVIGLGVSACLMASFTAFGLWFAPGRLASLNAAVMAAGGLGALTATVPLGWLVNAFGWRTIFEGLTLAAVLVALGIWSTPERRPAAAGERLGQQLAGLASILRSASFWRFAPQTTFVVGGFMALQGLWAVPWLMTVAGQSREAAAFHLLLVSLAMLTGFMLIAFFVNRLAKIGIGPERIMTVGIGVGLAAILCIVLNIGPSYVLWFTLGLLFSVGNLGYALLSTQFPVALAGRANTALNLAVFVGAFAIQWGYGIAMDQLTAAGFEARQAHQATLGGLLALQVLSFLWFLRPPKK